ncbi:PEP-CTERM sorting domain-containing protein [Sphingomonas aerophila]|uniref:Ice-binding protein C-terminal domain-containing protein n=1 Tax=Sphingomonas aerophila TaxID=1344948 RepID=A0A7W9BD35_9SPHN|nr:PEP-CTERM sorting domain-containing protein [Sphingomonas aerophila]MBB5714793.1 hypothetical protein [Sphingomonas aerophila]
MHRITSSLAVVACLTMTTAGVAAGPVTFSGSGVINSTGGKLAPSGVSPVGSAFNFRFSFDPATASLIQSDDGYALYDLAVSKPTATLGGFSFPASNDPVLTPLVELSRGFSFFGGDSSEPSLAFTFFLLGTPTTSAADTPFLGSAGRSQQLAIGGVFRSSDLSAPLTINSLFGSGTPFYQNFEYGTRDPALRQSGLLEGSYVGSFTAPVPEPATWASMIAGLSLAGGVAGYRRRRKTKVRFA